MLKYAESNVIPRRLKVKALDENSLYEVIETGEVFGGDELMYIGLGKLENLWETIKLRTGL